MSLCLLGSHAFWLDLSEFIFLLQPDSNDGWLLFKIEAQLIWIKKALKLHRGSFEDDHLIGHDWGQNVSQVRAVMWGKCQLSEKALRKLWSGKELLARKHYDMISKELHKSIAGSVMRKWCTNCSSWSSHQANKLQRPSVASVKYFMMLLARTPQNPERVRRASGAVFAWAHCLLQIKHNKLCCTV